jgi:hypothetical protein
MLTIDPIPPIPLNEIVETLLYIAGSILSAILCALAVFAYRKSGIKKLLYAAIAFSLFCMFLIYENLEHRFSLDNSFTDIIIPLSGLAIIVFFFLAAIRKPNR